MPKPSKGRKSMRKRASRAFRALWMKLFAPKWVREYNKFNRPQK